MGRLDRKVIVLSAAAQGIGRAAAIVMNFNKTSQRECFTWDCVVSIVKAVYLSANMTVEVPSWISTGPVAFNIGAAKHILTHIFAL